MKWNAYKISLLLGCLQAMATTIGPSSADPARALNQIIEIKKSIPLMHVEDPIITVHTPGKIGHAQLERVAFVLDSIILEGVRNHQEGVWKKLHLITAPYVGKTITLVEVKKIAEQLERVYHEEGLIMTQVIVPPQPLEKEGARIKLQIIEGKIKNILVKGGTKNTDNALELYAAQIEGKTPLTKENIDSFITLSNGVPGAHIQKLEISQNVDGSAEIEAHVMQKRAGGYIGLNNRGTEYLGSTQIHAGASMYSLFGADKLDASVAFVVPESNRMRFVGAEYQRMIGSGGSSIQTKGYYSHINPKGSLRALALEGTAGYADGSYTYKIVRSKTEIASLEGGMYVQHVESRSQATNTVIYQDRIRALFLKAVYQMQDFMMGSNHAELKITQGLDLFSASKEGNYILSRPNASGVFLKISGMLSHDQPLWNNFSVYGAAKGQYAFRSLLVAEQFGYADSNTGGAYDYSEIIGDHGISIRAEARYAHTSSWPGMVWAQPYAFWDVAKTSNVTDTVEALAQSASSAGFGVRIEMQPRIVAAIEMAYPLTRPVESLGEKKSRFFFNIYSKI